MPTIACPKCQTKYELPESALGKSVKCQKCNATFRTAAPGPGKQAAVPVAGGPAQPSAGELAKMGIDGPLKRQADIFSSPPPPPQRGNPLGNFVIEDPGFADVNTARQEAKNESDHVGAEGMESIVANPYSSVTGGRKRKKTSDVDLSGYGVARTGMWIVFISWTTMMVLMIIIYAFSWLADIAPKTSESITQSSVFGVIALVMVGLMLFSVGMVVIGQIVCIFSPNKDEKTFAGLAVGSLFAAVIVPIVAALLGSLSEAAVDATNAGDGAKAVIGLMLIVTIISAYALLLANMFFFIVYFKRIGKNIRSKAVMESAQTAMVVWLAAIVIALLAGVTMVVLAFVLDRDESFQTVVKIVGLLNAILGFSVMGTLIVMVKSAIQKTAVAPG
ncbi:MAG: putative Zn finger-like uncharacterized protein [Mariniblastus sp.]|jgi:predicted Zn finger-like uncharacterized protein